VTPDRRAEEFQRTFRYTRRATDPKPVTFPNGAGMTVRAWIGFAIGAVIICIGIALVCVSYVMSAPPLNPIGDTANNRVKGIVEVLQILSDEFPKDDACAYRISQYLMTHPDLAESYRVEKSTDGVTSLEKEETSQ
jgi:hypothetical protein